MVGIISSNLAAHTCASASCWLDHKLAWFLLALLVYNKSQKGEATREARGAQQLQAGAGRRTSKSRLSLTGDARPRFLTTLASSSCRFARGAAGATRAKR